MKPGTPGTPGTPKEWWSQPAIILPAVALLVVVAALLTPQRDGGRLGDGRLTTHSTSALGARLFSDVASRMGWDVVQRETAELPAGAAGRTVHAVMAPVDPPTPSEAHDLLQRVRAGDGLLIVLGDRNPLSDSLGVTHYVLGANFVAPARMTAGCRKSRDIAPLLWSDDVVHLWGLRWLRGRPLDEHVFAALSMDSKSSLPFDTHAAVGFPLARGRVVVISDPDFLRNDALRRCAWGLDVAAINALEWLRAGGERERTHLVFDEYHQGYGDRPSVSSATVAFLVGHPVGRLVLQLGAAALLLIVVAAPRPLPPQHNDHFERRNPLEHVDALALAYEKVRATRTIVSRLVRGLRWRVDRTASMPSRTDDMFLRSVATEKPQLAGDVDIVMRGLNTALADRELAQVGDALHRIESGLNSRL